MKKILFCILSVFCMIGLASCSKDGDGSFIPESLVGYWCGAYYTDRGDAWLEVSFESDGTGNLQLETPTGLVRYAEFYYSVSGNTVKCKGASADTNGDTSENFSIIFLMDGEFLIPQDQYTQFILKQDGYVGVNSNGEIVEDQIDLFKNIWITENGYELYNFKDKNKVDWYELYEPFSKKYAISFLNDEYFYDFKFKELTYYRYNYGKLYITKYSIVKLDSESLVLKNISTNNERKFKRGSKSDIPTEKVDKYFGY